MKHQRRLRGGEEGESNGEVKNKRDKEILIKRDLKKEGVIKTPNQ